MPASRAVFFQRGMPLLSLVMGVGLILPAAEAAGVRPRVVALSGEVAPSTPGLNLSSFRLETLGIATINDRGDVVYTAILDRENRGEKPIGLWIDPAAPGEPDRSLGIIESRSAPGLPPTTRFSGVSLPSLDEAGNVLATQFVMDDAPGSDDTTGVWSATPDGVEPVLLPGQTLPGYDPGEVVLSGSHGDHTSSGLALLSAFSSQGRRGLWRYDGGQPELVALTGTPAEGFPGFTLYRTSGRINDAGEMVIELEARNGIPSQSALYRVDAEGAWQRLVADGSFGGTPPGTPAGSEYAGLGDIRINEAGTISFATQYRAPSGEVGRGIWIIPPGETEPHPVVVTGQSTPDGTGVFTAVLAQHLNYNLNANGQIGFQAFIDENGVETRSGWIGGVDGLDRVSVAGEPVSGWGEGVVAPAASPTVSDLGTEFYRVRLSGTGVTLDNDQALLYRLPGGVLEPILREGQLFEVAPGDQRLVEEWDGLNYNSQLNSRDELVLGISFADGSSGIFVFAVPEPTGAGLASAVLLPLAGKRRRRPCASC